jgi:hypothetical protein
MSEQERKFKAVPNGSEITFTNLDPSFSDRAAYGQSGLRLLASYAVFGVERRFRV